MEKLKILVNREPLSKDYVQSKANFGHVLSQVKNLKPPVWKTPWFYGPVGIATVAISLSVFAFKPIEKEKKTSLHQSNVTESSIIKKKPILAVASSFELDSPSNEKTIPPKKNGEVIEKEHKEILSSEEIPDEVSQELILIESEELIIEEKVLSPYPNIEGVFTAEIPVDKLCSSTGIVTSRAKVISFNIQYFDGREDVIERISGNSLSKTASNFIRRYNLKSMIFITKIIGITEEGNQITIPSLNYIPI